MGAPAEAVRGLVGRRRANPFSGRRPEAVHLRFPQSGSKAVPGRRETWASCRGRREIDLEPLTLDTNFRSQPHLIDWCNTVFENTVMAEPKAEFDEVPFSPAILSPDTPVRPDPAPVELALFMEWPCRESARVREAQWLAGRVAQHLEKNGRDSQTAILLFSRTHLPIYLEALMQMRVPVQVKQGLKLMERPEVHYLWQLCRGIVLPSG